MLLFAAYNYSLVQKEHMMKYSLTEQGNMSTFYFPVVRLSLTLINAKFFKTI